MKSPGAVHESTLAAAYEQRDIPRTSRTVVSVFNLSPRRVGGIETMARELSLQLGQHGWTSVLCFRRDPVDAVRQFLKLPNVELEVIPELSRWSIGCYRRLATTLRRYHPSILHLNFVDLLAPYALLARLLGVTGVFFTDHISRPQDYSSRRTGILKRAAYRGAVPVTKVFCVSDFVRRCWVESARLPRDRFVTVYNGVDLARCDESRRQRRRFRMSHSIPDGALVVTQISSLIPEKGCGTLLKAAKDVCAGHPSALFVLAGDGGQRSEYELLAERLEISDRVRFLGLVGDPVGEGLFAASDIVCQASNWQEAFGLSIAEAMACELPVVATRVGGIPELVQDGVTGILVDRGDAVGLAKGILKLANSERLRAECGGAARRFCAAHFDHRANAAKMIELYRLSSFSPYSS